MSDAAGCCECCDPTADTGEAIDSYTGTMAPELEQIREVGFSLIFETGVPVPIEALAEKSGLPISEVVGRLTLIEDVGRVRRNADGDLVGIAGLSLEPTAHSVSIEGRDFWTWCALDAVGIFSAMRATGGVRSSPPGGTGPPLQVEFRKGVADSGASVFIAGGYDGKDVFQSWCPKVNFFASAEEAHAWSAQMGIDGDVVTIPEIAETAGSIWKSVVNGARVGDFLGNGGRPNADRSLLAFSPPTGQESDNDG